MHPSLRIRALARFSLWLSSVRSPYLTRGTGSLRLSLLANSLQRKPSLMLQVSPMSAHRREEPHTFLKLPAPHLGFEGQSLSVDSNPELQDPIYSAPRRQRSRLSCLSILLLKDSEMGFVQKKFQLMLMMLARWFRSIRSLGRRATLLRVETAEG